MKRKILSILSAVSLLGSALLSGMVFASANTDTPVGMYEDFEQMTDEQAAQLFSYGGNTATVSIAEGKGENGSKALKIEVSSVGEGWFNYTMQKYLELKGSAISIWYSVETDAPLRIGIKKDYGGAWSDGDFVPKVEGELQTVKAGSYRTTLIYDEYADLEVSREDLQLGIEGLGVYTIYIDNILFYDFETVEDFELMSSQAAEDYFSYNTDGDASIHSIADGAGAGESKALKIEVPTANAGWFNLTGQNAMTMQGVGIRIWFRLEQATALRIGMKNDGNWTTGDFVAKADDGSLVTLQPGTYQKTIYFADHSDLAPGTGNIVLGLEGAGTAVIYLDNIQFIGDLPEEQGPGDKTELNAQLEQYRALYESNNADESYGAESYAAFKEAYEAARDLPDDATQRQIDLALRTLQYTFESLVQLKLDYSALTEAIADADTFFASSPEDTYTEHSIGMIRNVYNTAKEMLNDETATTQRQIDDMVITLNTAVSNACPIPDLDAEYPALDADRLLEDFEEYEATGDIVMGGGTTDGWQFEGNSAFRTQLDKTTPISGEKSLKISWTGLGEDVWGAHRLFMYHTGAFPMGNQAMTFTIKVDFDFTMTVAFYDMTGQPVQYTYTKVIQASDEPQTVTLPFNQFVNTNTSNYNYGSNVPADQWATYINQWLCFKIQIDRLSGLPENGEMWLDCFKLTTTEGPQEPAPAPILPDNPDNPGGGDPEDPEDPGVIVPDDPQPDDSDGFHVQQDFEEMTAADLTENFTSTPEGALTLDTAGALFGDNSLKMTYDLAGADSSTSFATAFPGLRGDGLYMQVLSANDALMTVRLDDGSLWVEYNIAITGSEEPQLVFANWVDTVAGRGTFDELNKAAVTMTVTLSSEEAVSGDIFLDNIGYFVYDEMLDTSEEEPPIVDPDDPTDPSDPTDPDDPTNPGDPGEPVIPPTGEATAVATVTALGLTAAAVAAVTYRRRKTK